jgi:hypothetical protein
MNVVDEKMQLQLILRVHRNYEKNEKSGTKKFYADFCRVIIEIRGIDGKYP